jgi:hypothetical protein
MVGSCFITTHPKMALLGHFFCTAVKIIIHRQNIAS